MSQQTRRWLAAGVFEAMTHDLRAMLRWADSRADAPTAVVFDSATRQSTPKRGHRAEDDGYKRRKGSKLHAAVDTLGHLLVIVVPPADAQDRAQVAALAGAVQEATGQSVEVAFVAQGYTGQQSATDATAQGIRLEVVKLEAAKQGFELLPRRWVERSLCAQGEGLFLPGLWHNWRPASRHRGSIRRGQGSGHSGDDRPRR